jgi:cystathionine beta-synthase
MEECVLTVELQSAVWWSKHTVANLTLNPPVTITPEVTCSEAVEILQRCVHVVRSCAFSSFTRWYSEGFDQVPVVDDTSKILGMLTEGALMKKLLYSRPAALCRRGAFSTVLYVG